MISRIAYRVTGTREILEKTGALSYNRGNYAVAYRDFLEAGRPLLAAWSAIRAGDYELAYRALKGSGLSTRDHYLWYLETLYWTGRDQEMEEVLRSVKDRFPDLYREYMGWLLFKRERWEEASRFFTDPYHRALALYNAGRVRHEVLETLKGSEGYKERILKAKAAVSTGRGDLARRFLRGETPEEIYLMGMSHFIEERYSKAIDYFRRIKGSGAVGRRALLRIGDSLYNLGRYEEAKNVYREILKKFPDSREATEATLALAQIELQNPSQDLKTLIYEFEKKFPNSPLIPDLRYQLANLYIKEGKITKAKGILEDLMGVEPLRYKAMLKMAEIEENPARKEDLLKRIIEGGGPEERERASGLLVSLYRERGEFEKLADFLAKGGVEERKRALILYLDHNMEKAVSLFEDLIRENPESEDLKTLALSMYEKTRGKRYLEIAVGSQDPKVRAEALYRLGLVEKKRTGGRPSNASWRSFSWRRRYTPTTTGAYWRLLIYL
ncbi:MAG: tetratricopeptide repeat protein [Aquificota bacterium]|nr:tetratricopeptide repeat protein [Aquificota bacterium]